MAKARVTHKKVLTMPRLELITAVTTVKISNLLRDFLEVIRFREYIICLHNENGTYTHGATQWERCMYVVYMSRKTA